MQKSLAIDAVTRYNFPTFRSQNDQIFKRYLQYLVAVQLTTGSTFDRSDNRGKIRNPASKGAERIRQARHQTQARNQRPVGEARDRTRTNRAAFLHLSRLLARPGPGPAARTRGTASESQTRSVWSSALPRSRIPAPAISYSTLLCDWHSRRYFHA